MVTVHTHTHDIYTHMHTHHTVQGAIDSSEFQGVTHTHEHVLIQCYLYQKKPNYTDEDLSNLKFEIGNLGKLRYYAYVHLVPHPYGFAVNSYWL